MILMTMALTRGSLELILSSSVLRAFSRLTENAKFEIRGCYNEDPACKATMRCSYEQDRLNLLLEDSDDLLCRQLTSSFVCDLNTCDLIGSNEPAPEIVQEIGNDTILPQLKRKRGRPRKIAKLDLPKDKNGSERHINRKIEDVAKIDAENNECYYNVDDIKMDKSPEGYEEGICDLLMSVEQSPITQSSNFEDTQTPRLDSPKKKLLTHKKQPRNLPSQKSIKHKEICKKQPGNLPKQKSFEREKICKKSPENTPSQKTVKQNILYTCEICQENFLSKNALNTHDCESQSVKEPVKLVSLKHQAAQKSAKVALNIGLIDDIDICTACLMCRHIIISRKPSIRSGRLARHVQKNHQVSLLDYCELLDSEANRTQMNGARKYINKETESGERAEQIQGPFHCVSCEDEKGSFQEFGALLLHIHTSHLGEANHHNLLVSAENNYAALHKAKIEDGNTSEIKCKFCDVSRRSDFMLIHLTTLHAQEKDLAKVIAQVKRASIQQTTRHGKFRKIGRPPVENSLVTTCQYCGKTFADRYTRYRHSRFKCPQNSTLCKKIYCRCGTHFVSQSSLAKHKLRCDQIDKRCICHLCGKVYATKNGLFIHKQTAHCEDIDSKYKYHCSTCDVRYYRKTQYVRHMRMHTEERSCTCDKCGKAFKSAEDVRNHQDRIHYNKYPYRCPICGHGVDKKAYLKSHRCGHVRRSQRGSETGDVTKPIPPSEAKVGGVGEVGGGGRGIMECGSEAGGGGRGILRDGTKMVVIKEVETENLCITEDQRLPQELGVGRSDTHVMESQGQTKLVMPEESMELQVDRVLSLQDQESYLNSEAPNLTNLYQSKPDPQRMSELVSLSRYHGNIIGDHGSILKTPDYHGNMTGEQSGMILGFGNGATSQVTTDMTHAIADQSNTMVAPHNQNVAYGNPTVSYSSAAALVDNVTYDSSLTDDNDNPEMATFQVLQVAPPSSSYQNNGQVVPLMNPVVLQAPSGVTTETLSMTGSVVSQVLAGYDYKNYVLPN